MSKVCERFGFGESRFDRAPSNDQPLCVRRVHCSCTRYVAVWNVRPSLIASTLRLGQMHAVQLPSLHVQITALGGRRSQRRAFSTACPSRQTPRCPRNRAQPAVRSQTDTDYR